MLPKHIEQQIQDAWISFSGQTFSSTEDVKTYFISSLTKLFEKNYFDIEKYILKDD